MKTLRALFLLTFLMVVIVAPALAQNVVPAEPDELGAKVGTTTFAFGSWHNSSSGNVRVFPAVSTTESGAVPGYLVEIGGDPLAVYDYVEIWASLIAYELQPNGTLIYEGVLSSEMVGSMSTGSGCSGSDSCPGIQPEDPCTNIPCSVAVQCAGKCINYSFSCGHPAGNPNICGCMEWITPICGGGGDDIGFWFKKVECAIINLHPDRRCRVEVAVNGVN